MNKGQISLFVILGIIVIGVIAFTMYFKSTAMESVAEKEAKIMAALPSDVAEIRKDIAECSQQLFEEALVEVGRYGGYNTPLENSLSVGDNFVTYGYFEGRKVLPTIETVKAEMAEFIEVFLPDCVDFSQYGLFEIEDQEPDVKMDIFEEGVEAEVSYDVTAKQEGKEFRLDEPYGAEASVRLLGVHESAKKIVDKAAESPETLDIDSLLELNVDVNVIPVDEKSVVYSIEDKDSKLTGVEGEQSFKFIFATKAE